MYVPESQGLGLDGAFNHLLGRDLDPVRPLVVTRDGVEPGDLLENLLELDLVFPNGLLDSSNDGNDSEASLSVAAYMIKSSKILSWLFQQLDQEESSMERKARSVEILSLLSQKEDVFGILPDWTKIPAMAKGDDNDNLDGPTKKKKKTEPSDLDGIEILLQTVGQYRKKQPETELDVELLENTCGT